MINSLSDVQQPTIQTKITSNPCTNDILIENILVLFSFAGVDPAILTCLLVPFVSHFMVQCYGICLTLPAFSWEAFN